MAKYIDADGLAKDLEQLCDIVCQYSKEQRDVMCRSCPLGDAFELLDSQPAADVQEVRHGRWETEITTNRDGTKSARYACSVCGVMALDEWNYCTNCEAKMDEVEE